MNEFINFSLTSLFEYAIPTKGSYSAHIGTVAFGDYYTLVMTYSGEVQIGKNTYQMVYGYILVKQLADYYKKHNTDAKLKQFGAWKLNKTLNSQLYKSISEDKVEITIEGSSEVKGTYFHPSVVLDVLEWLCPAFKQEIKAVYENYVVEYNSIRYAAYYSLEGNTDSELIKHNVRFLDAGDSDIEVIDEAEGETLYDLDQKLKKLQDARELVNDLQQYKALTNEIEQIYQAIQNAELEDMRRNQYKGTLYELYKKGSDKPFYVGITDQKPKDDETSEQLRFYAHVKQCIDMLKTPGFDYAHVYMLGEMVSYAQTNGIQKCELRPADFYQLFTVQMIKNNVKDRYLLEQLETEQIRLRTDQQCLLMNMKKNSQYGTRKRYSLAQDTPSTPTNPDPTVKAGSASYCPKCQGVFKRIATHKCKY